MQPSIIHFSSDFFAQALGSKYTFQAYRFTFNKYGSLSERQVLAYNLFLCGTGGEPPFYGKLGYLFDSSCPNMLWFSLVPRTSNDAFVGFRCDSNSLLKQAIEHLAPRT